MSRILLLVCKDALRRRRAPLGILTVLAFPLVFSLLLALTFGTGEAEIPRVHLLIEDRDDGPVSEFIVSAFGSEEMAKHFDIEIVGEEGQSLMEQGEASALLRIPEGFSEALIRGKPTTLQLVRNPAEQIMPEIAEELSKTMVDFFSSASRVLRGPLDEIVPLLDDDDGTVSDEQVASIAVMVNRLVTRAQDFIFPPAITMESVTLEKAGEEPGGSGAASIFLVILPGISVWSLFMLGETAMRDILAEGAAGTLRRQLSGPIGTGTLVAGKALFTAILSAFSLALLSAIGWAVSERPIDFAGFVVLSLALVAAVTGTSALIFGLVRNERQGATIASVLFLIMAFAGGSFMPLDSLPAAVRAIAPWSLFYWGTSGYMELIRRGGGLESILPHAGILAGVGLAALAIGASALRRRMGRGETA